MRIIFLLLVVFFFTTASSQKIEMTRGFGGIQYTIGDTVELSSKQVLNIIKVNPVAYKGFKSARAKGTLSSVLGFGGGFLVGLPIASMIYGGEQQWGWVAVGAAMIGIAIPIDIAQKRQANMAIDLYNSGAQPKVQRVKANLIFSSAGVGVGVRF
jgi:hypothetical protein